MGWGNQCAPWDLDKKEKKKKKWGGGGGGGINYALIFFYHVDDRYFKFNHISFTAHRLFSVLSAIVLSHNLVYIFYKITVNIVIVKSATILPWHFLSVT